jgi:hypothetical protein
MAWILKDKEFRSVTALPGAQRYEYFLKRVIDAELVWSLVGADGWILYGDNEGHETVPVWPHEKYAEACAVGDTESLKPRSIELKAWLERWLPGIRRDQRLVAVFPVPAGEASGVVVTPDRLQRDLEELARQWYG